MSQQHSLPVNLNNKWIDSLPFGWQLKRLKLEICRNDGGVWGQDPTGDDDTIVLRSTEQSADGNWRIEDPAYRQISQAEKSKSLLQDGDLLITKSSGSELHIGKASLVTPDIEKMGCCYSNFMQRLRLKETLIPRFCWYFLNSGIARAQFNYQSNTSTGLSNLNSEIFGGLLIPYPPITTQREIVDFLDRETKKIDHLIKKQVALVNLLDEKRESEICRAVTMGVEKNVEMVDSNVPWIGKTPRHWEIRQSRYLFKQRKELSRPDDIQLTASQKLGILSQKDFIELEGRVVQVLIGSDILKHVEPNDFIISMRSFQGGLELSQVRGCISSAYVMLEPNLEKISCEFFKYLFKSRHYIQALQSTSNLVRDGQALRYSNFTQVPIPLPPLDEQVKIAEYLAAKINKIDNLSKKAKASITLLKERRGSFISATLAGKLAA